MEFVCIWSGIRLVDDCGEYTSLQPSIARAIVISPYVWPPRRSSHLSRISFEERKTRSICAASRPHQNASMLHKAISAALASPPYRERSPSMSDRNRSPLAADVARSISWRSSNLVPVSRHSPARPGPDFGAARSHRPSFDFGIESRSCSRLRADCASLIASGDSPNRSPVTVKNRARS